MQGAQLGEDLRLEESSRLEASLNATGCGTFVAMLVGSYRRCATIGHCFAMYPPWGGPRRHRAGDSAAGPCRRCRSPPPSTSRYRSAGGATPAARAEAQVLMSHPLRTLGAQLIWSDPRDLARRRSGNRPRHGANARNDEETTVHPRASWLSGYDGSNLEVDTGDRHRDRRLDPDPRRSPRTPRLHDPGRTVPTAAARPAHLGEQVLDLVL